MEERASGRGGGGLDRQYKPWGTNPRWLRPESPGRPERPAVHLPGHVGRGQSRQGVRCFPVADRHAHARDGDRPARVARMSVRECRTIEEEIMHIRVMPSRDHHGREGFRPYVEGQHALVLEDDAGAFQGELVWRLANIGQGIAEITGMGITDVANRRKGWGSRLLQTAIDDIRAFMREQEIEPRLVYLFANGQDPVAQSFYEARGFRFLTEVPDLYARGTAWLYARNLTDEADKGS